MTNQQNQAQHQIPAEPRQHETPGFNNPQQQFTVPPGHITFQSIQQPLAPQPQGRNVIYKTTIRRPQTVWVNFNSVKARALGITQVIVALLCFIFNGVGIALEARLDYEECNDYYCHEYYGPVVMFVGYGFWCGAFYLISGALAIRAAKTKTDNLLKATLGMSIMSCILGFMLLGSSLAALVLTGNDSGYIEEDKTAYQGYMASAVFLLIFSIVEIVCSSWVCRLSGIHVCCCKRAKTETVVHYVSNPGTGSMAQYVANPAGGMTQYTANPAGGMTQSVLTVPAHQGSIVSPQTRISMDAELQPGISSTGSPLVYQTSNTVATVTSDDPPPYTVAASIAKAHENSHL